MSPVAECQTKAPRTGVRPFQHGCKMVVRILGNCYPNKNPSSQQQRKWGVGGGVWGGGGTEGGWGGMGRERRKEMRFCWVQVPRIRKTILQPCEKVVLPFAGLVKRCQPGSSIIAAQERDLIPPPWALQLCCRNWICWGQLRFPRSLTVHERDNGPATGIFEFVPERAAVRCLEFGAEDRTPSFTEWFRATQGKLTCHHLLSENASFRIEGFIVCPYISILG